MWRDRTFSNNKIIFFLLLQQIRSTFHWLFRSWPESHQYSKYFHGFHRFPTKGYLICKNQTKMESLRNTNYLRTAPQLGRKTKSKMLDTANQKQTTLFYIRNNQRKFFFNLFKLLFCPVEFTLEFPFFSLIAVLVQWWQVPIMANPCQSWEVYIHTYWVCYISMYFNSFCSFCICNPGKSCKLLIVCVVWLQGR